MAGDRVSYGGGGSSWSLVPWEFASYDDASCRAVDSRRFVARLDQARNRCIILAFLGLGG